MPPLDHLKVRGLALISLSIVKDQCQNLNWPKADPVFDVTRGDQAEFVTVAHPCRFQQEGKQRKATYDPREYRHLCGRAKMTPQ